MDNLAAQTSIKADYGEKVKELTPSRLGRYDLV